MQSSTRWGKAKTFNPYEQREPGNPAIQEAEAGGLEIKSSPGNLLRLLSQSKIQKKDWGYSSMTDCLPSMSKGLPMFNPQYSKKQTNKTPDEQNHSMNIFKYVFFFIKTVDKETRM